MKCPKCGAEYRDGYTICSDCDVQLEEETPQKPPELRPRIVRGVVCAAWVTVVVVLSVLPRPSSFDEWYARLFGLGFMGSAIENVYAYFRPESSMTAKRRERVDEWKKRFGFGYYVLGNVTFLLLCGICLVLLRPTVSIRFGLFVLGAFSIHALLSGFLYLRLRLRICSSSKLHRQMIRTYAWDSVLGTGLVLLIAFGFSPTLAADKIVRQSPVKVLVGPLAPEDVGAMVYARLQEADMRKRAVELVPDEEVRRVVSDSFVPWRTSSDAPTVEWLQMSIKDAMDLNEKRQGRDCWLYQDEASLLEYGRIDQEQIIGIFKESHPDLLVTDVLRIESRPPLIRFVGKAPVSNLPAVLVIVVEGRSDTEESGQGEKPNGSSG